METYAYLILGLSLLFISIILLIMRKDLRTKILIIGMVGGLSGLIAELFYFRDYWKPPTLMGISKISVEDFIFGFAITTVSFAIYPVINRLYFKKGNLKSFGLLYSLFFVIGLIGFITLSIVMNINSIFVSSALFFVFSFIILFLRKDLLKVGVSTAIIVTTVLIFIYIVIFNYLVPNYWDNYWLLANTKFGLTILGNIPATELIWYFSWALFASISYPFARGKILHKQALE